MGKKRIFLDLDNEIEYKTINLYPNMVESLCKFSDKEVLVFLKALVKRVLKGEKPNTGNCAIDGMIMMYNAGKQHITNKYNKQQNGQLNLNLSKD